MFPDILFGSDSNHTSHTPFRGQSKRKEHKRWHAQTQPRFSHCENENPSSHSNSPNRQTDMSSSATTTRKTHSTPLQREHKAHSGVDMNEASN
jgi:hypothetical protein